MFVSANRVRDSVLQVRHIGPKTGRRRQCVTVKGKHLHQTPAHLPVKAEQTLLAVAGTAGSGSFSPFHSDGVRRLFFSAMNSVLDTLDRVQVAPCFSSPQRTDSGNRGI